MSLDTDSIVESLPPYSVEPQLSGPTNAGSTAKDHSPNTLTAFKSWRALCKAHPEDAKSFSKAVMTFHTGIHPTWGEAPSDGSLWVVLDSDPLRSVAAMHEVPVWPTSSNFEVHWYCRPKGTIGDPMTEALHNLLSRNNRMYHSQESNQNWIKFTMLCPTEVQDGSKAHRLRSEVSRNENHVYVSIDAEAELRGRNMDPSSYKCSMDTKTKTLLNVYGPDIFKKMAQLKLNPSAFSEPIELSPSELPIEEASTVLGEGSGRSRGGKCAVM